MDIDIPRKWSELSYAGEKRVPPAEDPKSGSWPTYFLSRDKYGNFIDSKGKEIAFKIRQPDMVIDFEGEQLDIVRKTLKKIRYRQICIAKYWGTGPATKQWTPIIDRLIDTYSITAPRAARMLAAFQAALNDAFVISWYLKFLWQIPRPNQFDQNLATILCTPRHPSYPSGHAATAGCAQVVLSYFFESETDRLRELAEEAALARLLAGVHFPIDNEQGLSLGRHIGEIVVDILDKQRDNDQCHIDYPITENLNAKLLPPPYRQVIPFTRNISCGSKLLIKHRTPCTKNSKLTQDNISQEKSEIRSSSTEKKEDNE